MDKGPDWLEEIGPGGWGLLSCFAFGCALHPEIFFIIIGVFCLMLFVSTADAALERRREAKRKAKDAAATTSRTET